MKLLLKSIVFFALAVWLAESAPASLDSSASSNARERRSEANLLEDLLRSLRMVQQQQQEEEEEEEEEEEDETPVDREGDGDDYEGAITSIEGREMLMKFFNAMASVTPGS